MRIGNNSGGEDVREVPSEDVHDAVVGWVWDVGLHRDDRSGESKPKCCVVYELAQRDSHGRPFQVFKDYTASVYRGTNKASALREVCDKLGVDVSEGLDTTALHGRPCRVEVETSTGRGKVASVMKPGPAGAAMKPYFDYTDDRPLGLAKYLREKAVES